MDEDWEFEIAVTDGEAHDCRLGIEMGDTFIFQYGSPDGICPRIMAEAFVWCEVVRCGGDFTHRGTSEKYAMELRCPCGSIGYRLTAHPINRDENGVYIGKCERPR